MEYPPEHDDSIAKILDNSARKKTCRENMVTQKHTKEMGQSKGMRRIKRVLYLEQTRALVDITVRLKNIDLRNER